MTNLSIKAEISKGGLALTGTILSKIEVRSDEPAQTALYTRQPDGTYSCELHKTKPGHAEEISYPGGYFSLSKVMETIASYGGLADATPTMLTLLNTLDPAHPQTTTTNYAKISESIAALQPYIESSIAIAKVDQAKLASQAGIPQEYDNRLLSAIKDYRAASTRSGKQTAIMAMVPILRTLTTQGDLASFVQVHPDTATALQEVFTQEHKYGATKQDRAMAQVWLDYITDAQQGNATPQDKDTPSHHKKRGRHPG